MDSEDSEESEQILDKFWTRILRWLICISFGIPLFLFIVDLLVWVMYQL